MPLFQEEICQISDVRVSICLVIGMTIWHMICTDSQFPFFTHCQWLFHPHPYDYSCIFRGDGNFLKARQEAKKGELDEQLREYINEWRKQRSKEEEELQRLKEKQTKRKEIRAEQEKKLAQQKREEEIRRGQEEADKKAREAEEKRKRLEAAEIKRQQMMQAQKEKQNAGGAASEGGGGNKFVGGVSAQAVLMF